MVHLRKHILLIILTFFYKINAQLFNCESQPCQNGGTCINQPSILYGYRCNCPQYFVGYDCQNKKNDEIFYGIKDSSTTRIPKVRITKNSIKAISTTIKLESTSKLVRADLKSRGCLSNPCLNGGFCDPLSQSTYNCLCQFGTYGTYCEFQNIPASYVYFLFIGTLAPVFTVIMISCIVVYFCYFEQ